MKCPVSEAPEVLDKCQLLLVIINTLVVIVDTIVTDALIMVSAYRTHLKHDTLYYLADTIAFFPTRPLNQVCGVWT